MLKVSVQYMDNLVCEVRDEASDATVITDAKAEAKNFSPKTLLAAALTSCTASMIGYYAMNHNINVQGMKVESSAVVDEETKKIVKFVLNITIPQELSEDDIKKFGNVAKTCPVGQLLDPSIEIEHNIVCSK